MTLTAAYFCFRQDPVAVTVNTIGHEFIHVCVCVCVYACGETKHLSLSHKVLKKDHVSSVLCFLMKPCTQPWRMRMAAKVRMLRA